MHTLISRIRLAGAVVILLALTGGARADKVDWSQYIDKNPSAPVSAPATTAAAKPAARPEKAARPAKAVANKAKAKPRAKAKSSRK
jgi:hypothetical protein